MNGPWTYQGYLAPQGDLTWMTQSTWVMPIVGSAGTTYVYWGDHWYGDESTAHPGQHNNLTTYVFQPLVFTGTQDWPTDLPGQLEAGRRRRHLGDELATAQGAAWEVTVSGSEARPDALAVITMLPAAPVDLTIARTLPLNAFRLVPL